MLVHGRKEDIKENPPMAIVEFYDQDKVGKNSFIVVITNTFLQFNKAEFIGRTFAKPQVFLEDDLVR